MKPAKKASDHPKPGDAPAKQPKKTALVVDDSEINRMILGKILTDQKYETYFAADGQTGFEQFTRLHPALVFLDIVMPRLSGLELLERIKQKSSHTRVIMVSSFISRENVIKAKAAGADWFLMKPFSKEKLLDVISRVVKTGE